MVVLPLQLAALGAHQRTQQRPANGLVTGRRPLKTTEQTLDVHGAYRLTQLTRQPPRQFIRVFAGKDLHAGQRHAGPGTVPQIERPLYFDKKALRLVPII